MKLLQINILIPTADDELKYIEELQHRNIPATIVPSWPNIPNISNFASLNQVQKKNIENEFKSKVYNEADYYSGKEIIFNHFQLINECLKKMQELSSIASWFKLYDEYTVTLTLYGRGGSFDPIKHSIILMTRIDGTFKRGNNPSHTIIHEIVEIAIYESITQKFRARLTHSQKEGVVDYIVSVLTKELMPDYEIGRNADREILQFLKQEMLEDLPQHISEYLSR